MYTVDILIIECFTKNIPEAVIRLQNVIAKIWTEKSMTIISIG